MRFSRASLSVILNLKNILRQWYTDRVRRMFLTHRQQSCAFKFTCYANVWNARNSKAIGFWFYGTSKVVYPLLILWRPEVACLFFTLWHAASRLLQVPATRHILRYLKTVVYRVYDLTAPMFAHGLNEMTAYAESQVLSRFGCKASPCCHSANIWFFLTHSYDHNNYTYNILNL